MPTEDQKRDEEKRDAFKLIVADLNQQLLALQVEAEPKIIAPMLDWSSKQRAVIEAAMAAAYRAGREDAAEAVWAKACELRKSFRTGVVGIEYVNGFEDATEVARGEFQPTPDESIKAEFQPTEEQPTEGQDRSEEQL